MSMRRLLIALVCYGLSGYGILATLLLMIEGFRHPEPSSGLTLILVYAWAAHLVLSISWIRGKTPHRFWPLSGTMAGICSIGMLPIGLPFVLPSMLLAAYLVRLHYQQSRTVQPPPQPMPTPLH